MSDQDAKQDEQELLPTTTMERAMAIKPGIPVALMKFHIGGCSLCGFEPQQTIAEVAEENGVPVERLLQALNEA